MERRHHDAVSKWLERVGLVIFGSLVIQKIFLGADITDPVLSLGIGLSITSYFFAFRLLLKS
jgi:hypothetical protein